MNPLWLDLEMTGLDENIHNILEIALMITDLDMNNLGEYHRIIHQPKEVLDLMDNWCKKTHGASGLLEMVPKGIPLHQAETEILELINKNYPKNERVILAGNSIWNDRRFIDRQMPELAKRLHYRMIDVSSFKEIFRNKFKVEYSKKNTHRAPDDIHESIAELKTYLSYFQISHTDR